MMTTQHKLVKGMLYLDIFFHQVSQVNQVSYVDFNAYS